jgi:Thioesterase-like superfamily
MSAAVFQRTPDGFFATELARGPWHPDAQHGGAPAALIMRALERCQPVAELVLARVSYEFMRPVPLGALTVHSEVVRPGRRVQLLEASLRTPDGTEVVRARALRVAVAEVVSSDRQSAAAQGPETAVANDFRAPRAMFATDALEIRFAAGAFYELGPATAWFRLRHPLVDGEAPSPLQRLAAAADFGNGISTSLPWEEYTFINPDLTLYVERVPVGEWICLQSETRVTNGSIGIAHSVLYDRQGRVGDATQALLITRNPLPA